MFADLLCPDCLADFPVIQSVAAHYGPQKLQWRLHFFPLPYHTVHRGRAAAAPTRCLPHRPFAI